MELEERAAEAEYILKHPLFVEAMDEVYSRALNTLETVDVGSLTASTAHATLKAISAIKRQMEQYAIDLKMRQKYPKGNSNGGD